MRWWMTCLLVFGALFAAGCIPVGVDAAYHPAGYHVKLKIGPVRILLLPRPEKQKKKRKKRKSAEKETPQKPVKKKDSGQKKSPLALPGGLDGILSLARLGCDVLGRFRRKLRVERLYLRVVFGGDAAKAAMNYGRAWAFIGALTPMLERCFVIRERDMQPELRYEQPGMTLEAQLVLTITIARALALALFAGVEFLKLMKNTKKGGAKYEPSSV